MEEKARERERKREEKRLVTELMVEYKKKRDDLECDDLKELPKPTPVQCRSDRCFASIMYQCRHRTEKAWIESTYIYTCPAVYLYFIHTIS